MSLRNFSKLFLHAGINRSTSFKDHNVNNHKWKLIYVFHFLVRRHRAHIQINCYFNVHIRKSSLCQLSITLNWNKPLRRLKCSIISKVFSIFLFWAWRLSMLTQGSNDDFFCRSEPDQKSSGFRISWSRRVATRKNGRSSHITYGGNFTLKTPLVRNHRWNR